MKNWNERVDYRTKIAGLNGKLGMIKRWDAENLEGIKEAQRAVTVAKIEQAIDKIIGSAPTKLEDVDIVHITSFIQNFYEEEDAWE